MPPCAFVRCAKIDNDTGARSPADAESQFLRAMEMHARGEGKRAEARRRPDATTRAVATAMNAAGKLLPVKRTQAGQRTELVAYRQAWRNHMEAQGAGIRKNAKMGLHLIVGVSPAWIAETGDVHDPRNPRNVALFCEARMWAEKALGGVFGVRLDVDEKGGGVVDVLVAPIREQGRMGARRPFVAVTQALRELARTCDRGMSYSAMQDSWTAWARRRLSPTIERGEARAQTQREHLSPEDYAIALAEEAKRGEDAIKRMLARARRKRRRAKIDERRNRLASKAIREAAAILRHERDEDLLREAVMLVDDATATIDGNADAAQRLDDRYAKGGAYDRGRAHTRPVHDLRSV